MFYKDDMFSIRNNNNCIYLCCFMNASTSLRLRKPTNLSTISPSLNAATVGRLLICIERVSWPKKSLCRQTYIVFRGNHLVLIRVHLDNTSACRCTGLMHQWGEHSAGCAPTVSCLVSTHNHTCSFSRTRRKSRPQSVRVP